MKLSPAVYASRFLATTVAALVGWCIYGVLVM